MIAGDSSHVGVMLPVREALRNDDPGSIGAFAALAEDCGFDSVWTGDSLLARPLFDPFIVLATAAARTRRIQLATGALLAPMRPLVLTAQAIASLDQLSGGRLIIGVGRGFDLPETRREFAAAGSNFEDRSRRLEETIRIWRQLWSSRPDAPVPVEGDVFRLEDVAFEPKPTSRRGPPIWLAGYGPVAFRRTAAFADGWLPYPPDASQYRAGWQAVCSHAEEIGRSPTEITPAVMVTVAFGEGAASHATLESYISTFYGYPLEIVSLIQACFAGPASQVVEWLSGYHEAGARAFVIRLASLTSSLRDLERFANDILPELRARLPSPAIAGDPVT